MKVAQIAPLYEAVPPSLYGGTERIVAHLTNALVELGHEVTLFASAEAHPRATLVMARNYLRLYRRLCGAADTADVCRRRSTQPAVQANGM
jgi:hypothetical protein